MTDARCKPTAAQALHHDQFALRHLRLHAPLVAALAEDGVVTVGDALSPSHRRALDALPTAESKRLEVRILKFLDVELPSLPPTQLDRQLDDFALPAKVRRALAAAGIDVVGALLATPRDELLALPGIGARSLAKALEHISATTAQSTMPADWLPDVVTTLRITDLDLPPIARDALRASATRTVGDLLLRPTTHTPATRDAVRTALARVLTASSTPRTDKPETFAAMLRRMSDGLEPLARRLFDTLLGVGRRALPLSRAASVARLPFAEAERLTETIRAAVRTEGGALLNQLLDDARVELASTDGVVGVETLAFRSRLWHAAHSGPDPSLPLRLLAFAFPEHCCFEAERLCALSSDALRDLVRVVRRELLRARPPVLVADLIAHSAHEHPPGVLLHVLRRVLGHSVTLHPTHGEIVTRRRGSVAARLEALLDDADAPLSLDDLLFRFRDRHGSASRRRIADTLRTGSAFVEIGHGQWSLRARHVDELELLRPEAERIAAELRTTGERHAVFDSVRRGEVSERSAHLLAELLRRDPTLRNLGRGEFIVRTRTASTIVLQLTAELRRAMGEVPFARFLQNQPAARRRLVSRLLRTNRAFVAPSRDRVDLLENFPFSPDRIRILLRVVENALAESGGYAPLSRVRLAVEEAELGGAYLTDHLLLDILRRHGHFEFLPGPWLAAPGVGLGRWIQRTARDILRSHVTALTAAQILADRPELAEFADTLAELLDQDPLVQTADGLHYQVV